MASIIFYLQSKKSPAGIYVRLRDGKSIDAKAKTKYSINPLDWSSAKGQPKNLKDDAFKKLNKQLVDLEADLLSCYNSSVGKSIINTEWLKEFINPSPKQTQITERLLEYFDYYIKCKGNELTESSIKKLNVIKNLIKRFETEARTEFLIKNVDFNFKLKFEAYCLKHGYASNTIARAVIFIKSICFHARANGVLTNFQLDNIKVKYSKADKVYLTPTELIKVENTNFEGDHLSNVRDWLLISCETGQRVSDFLRFKKEQIIIDEGKHLIEFTQVKTGSLMKIPLSKKVLSILRKRKGEFPRELSDQKYNDYVKEVCRLSGLTQKVKGSRKNPVTNRKEAGTFEKWELISSHVGRRSFATNNYGRVPTSILKYMTGHSTEKMFLEYIGKTPTETALQAAEYF